MNRRSFMLSNLGLILTACGGEMNYELQPSPTRTAHLGHSDVPGYAVGTWTPELRINNSSTGITYVTQRGTYIRIGHSVFVGFYVELTSKGVGAGNVTINGLPFTSQTGNTLTEAKGVISWGNMVSSFVTMILHVPGNNDRIQIYALTAASTDNRTQLTAAGIGNGAIFDGSIQYHARLR